MSEFCFSDNGQGGMICKNGCHFERSEAEGEISGLGKAMGFLAALEMTKKEVIEPDEMTVDQVVSTLRQAQCGAGSTTVLMMGVQDSGRALLLGMTCSDLF
ncbi:MAG: hypothetical protein SFU91_06705 [Chloroherpetonaceae bacterium]|nr:hypothetical protein [Chloroherpetonaceae bacterium]